MTAKEYPSVAEAVHSVKHGEQSARCGPVIISKVTPADFERMKVLTPPALKALDMSKHMDYPPVALDDLSPGQNPWLD
jgi:hypothetical protein